MKKLLSLVMVMMLVVAAIPALAADATDPSVVYTSENPIPDIAERVRPAVVQIICLTQTWDRQTNQVSDVESGYGSGVYIDERGYVITNNHVVSQADKIEIEWLDGTRMDAELLGGDSGTDIAIIKFDGETDAQPVPLGDSDQLRIGELCVAIGNPGTSDAVLFGTVTSGIISGLDREGVSASGSYTRNVNVIQMSAQINPGNSGGALLNGKGELIGIPTLKLMFDYSNIYEGLNFAIPINTAKAVINDLIDYGIVIRPRMGISVRDVTGPDEALKNYPPAGVQIMEVEPKSPADEAKLQAYDIITHINGERCRDYVSMTELLDEFKAGDKVTVSIARYYNASGDATSSPKFFDVDVELKILDK